MQGLLVERERRVASDSLGRCGHELHQAECAGAAASVGIERGLLAHDGPRERRGDASRFALSNDDRIPRTWEGHLPRDPPATRRPVRAVVDQTPPCKRVAELGRASTVLNPPPPPNDPPVD